MSTTQPPQPFPPVFKAKLAFLIDLYDYRNLFSTLTPIRQNTRKHEWLDAVIEKGSGVTLKTTFKPNKTSLETIADFVPAIASNDDQTFITLLFQLFSQNKPQNRLYIKTEADLQKEFEDFKKKYFSTIIEYHEKPYYTERLKRSFLQTHLDILQNALSYSDDDFKKFKEERLLSEMIDGKLEFFPALNLLRGDVKLLAEFEEDEDGTMKKAKLPATQDVLEKYAKEIMPNAVNNPTFAVKEINRDSNQVTSCLSLYFSSLFSCDRFHYNVVAKYPLSNPLSIERYKKEPFLDEWVRQLKKVIHNDFSEFSPSLGGSCLVIYNTGDSYEYLICSKDDSANAQKMQHVIPSFMMQPVRADVHGQVVKQLDLTQQMLREFAEEVLVQPEFNGHPGGLSKHLLAIPAIAALDDLIKKSKAELHHTGLWLDLIRLRPELSCVLIVDDPIWYNQYLLAVTDLGNWEVEKGRVFFHDAGNGYPNNSSPYYNLLKYQLRDENSQMKFDETKIGYLCAPGMAALIEGMKVFRDRKNKSKSDVVIENKSVEVLKLDFENALMSVLKEVITELRTDHITCKWEKLEVSKEKLETMCDRYLHSIELKILDLPLIVSARDFIPKLTEFLGIQDSMNASPAFCVIAKSEDIDDVNGFLCNSYELRCTNT